MKKLCIFDLDGTLTDTITAISHFGNLALASIGLAPIEKDKYKYMVGDGRSVLIHRILQYHNSDTEENYKTVCMVYDEAYEADPMYKTDAFDGIKELLAELKKRDTKIAVCSNKPHNVVCDVVKIVFGDIFDVVKGIDEGDKTKPDPENAIKIMESLGAEKNECLFIGDTNVDIRTAKNAGMESVGVLWGFRDEKELSEAGADHIINKPTEILEFI